MKRLPYIAIASALLLVAACTPPAEEPAATMDLPPLETRADSLAMGVLEALGGPAAWAELPYLRFDFGREQEGNRRAFRSHLWNRMTGEYRIEWQRGTDTTYVALLNVNTQAGTVSVNGDALSGEENEAQVARAYSMFINDTYWLLMPVKMLDPGVNRQYVADSSDAEYNVVHLSFGEVGLTPKDQYWVYVDKASNRIGKWCYVLQDSDPNAPPNCFQWVGYESFETAGGMVQVATRKQSMRTGSFLLTDAVEMPATLEADWFTDPMPRLME